MVADHCRGQVEAAGRRGEAAVLDHSDEGGNAGQASDRCGCRLSSHNPIPDYRARFEIPNFNWEGKQPFGKSSWTKGSTP
jgi:hypothetical protein